MVKKIDVSKSTIIFKINVPKLIDKYLNLMKSSVISHFNILKSYMKNGNVICSGNSTGFRWV